MTTVCISGWRTHRERIVDYCSRIVGHRQFYLIDKAGGEGWIMFREWVPRQDPPPGAGVTNTREWFLTVDDEELMTMVILACK